MKLWIVSIVSLLFACTGSLDSSEVSSSPLGGTGATHPFADGVSGSSAASTTSPGNTGVLGAARPGQGTAGSYATLAGMQAPLGGAGSAATGMGGVGGAMRGTGGTNGGVGGAGMAGTGTGGTSGTGGGTGGTTGAGNCVHASRLWFEDFETGDYSRWSSHTYCIGCTNNHWDANNCQSTALSTETAQSASHAERSEITCAYTANGNVHRGYGGLQFSGDQVLPAYTNAGTGLDAPFGVVNTFWIRVDTNTVFQNGKWVNFWTTNGTCDYSDDVLTLGIESPSNHLAAAHYQAGGGTRVDVPGTPGLPFGQWVRITVYVNYYDGTMHVWQNGQVVEHVTFHRASKNICQWHWGLYASGDNDGIVLFEDDNSLWKLGEAWTDFTKEPHLDKTVSTCK